MEEKDDILEQLREYPKQLELPKGVTARAKKRVEELHAPKRRARKKRIISCISSGVAAAVVLAVCIPVGIVYSNTPSPAVEPQYKVFSGSDLVYEPVTDTRALIAEWAPSMKYFEENEENLVGVTTGRAFFTVDDSEFVYLHQNATFIRGNEIDDAELNACSNDKRIDIFQKYFTFTERYSVSDYTVWYQFIKTDGAISGMEAYLDDGAYTYFLTLTAADFASMGKQERLECFAIYLNRLITITTE